MGVMRDFFPLKPLTVFSATTQRYLIPAGEMVALTTVIEAMSEDLVRLAELACGEELVTLVQTMNDRLGQIASVLRAVAAESPAPHSYLRALLEVQ